MKSMDNPFEIEMRVLKTTLFNNRSNPGKDIASCSLRK
jgi:hypothetical protein